MTTDIIKRYVDAWNNHDEVALVSLFTEGGTYQDSATEITSYQVRLLWTMRKAYGAAFLTFNLI